MIVLKRRKWSWTGVLLIKLKIPEPSVTAAHLHLETLREKSAEKASWLRAIRAHIVYADVVYANDVDLAFADKDALRLLYAPEEFESHHYKTVFIYLYISHPNC